MPGFESLYELSYRRRGQCHGVQRESFCFIVAICECTFSFRVSEDRNQIIH